MMTKLDTKIKNYCDAVTLKAKTQRSYILEEIEQDGLITLLNNVESRVVEEYLAQCAQAVLNLTPSALPPDEPKVFLSYTDAADKVKRELEGDLLRARGNWATTNLMASHVLLHNCRSQAYAIFVADLERIMAAGDVRRSA